MKRAMALLCLTAGAAGQDDRIVTIHGDEIAVRIAGFADDRLVLGTSAAPIALEEIAEIRLAGEAAATPTSHGVVVVRSGARIPAASVRGDGARVSFDSPWSERPVDLPLTAVRALRFAGWDDADGEFVRALANPHTTSDYLFATHRESGVTSRLSVRVVGFTGDRLEVETRRGSTNTLPADQIVGIVFGDSNGLSPTPAPRPRVKLHLRTGVTLAGKLLAWNTQALGLRIDDGPALSIPRSAIERVTIDSGRLASLSDLEPIDVTQTPAFDRVRPWLRDATPVGAGIELGGRRYSRGLCLVPRTTLTFALTPGEFDEFAATIGIDDRSSDLANAVFRVRLDERVVFESDAVARGSDPHPLRLPLGDAKQLVLETDFGENFDLGDHCVFAAARLLRSRPGG